MKTRRGRPKNQHEAVPPVAITCTPKLVAYLDDLVREEGYGNSRAEVVRGFVWRGIEDLIGKRVLKRRRSAP